ncbi:BREX-1 system adenine-specific DNA-methyltransferase PglX [Janibacter hoylei]|uniref:BREX-1 system adenine-specific DNA-methyltransferase PglX n=1 Tax=Janibacter hoylei TaxID=364298 RepID=UPI002238E5F2|nr:BREX-1 system adenine-specific DNA-methyltransferase PglX [Janibacter hoylei]MCW4602945.1 BREX-1 system adenine-specific DNA-methyltransferase PglX [Janibacter hoylei]
MAAVLAPGSSERVERARAVAALERAVSAAGGGDKGRAAVAERVAYTWFNRIVALRFMDANGYTGMGVVSPQAGVEVGQPEILAEAKRGVIDADVVRDATRKTVAALLDGTRASGDPQGEAYALLLEAYCNYWHRAMPFMFEREGDFTELLVPANLLADDSVLNRSVKVLTEDVCQDVEVIGWLYQFYISERKDEVFAGFKKNKKAGPDEIPAVTQLLPRTGSSGISSRTPLGGCGCSTGRTRAWSRRWTITSLRSTRRPTSSRSASPRS